MSKVNFTYVMAYGSNMLEKQMKERCPSAKYIATGEFSNTLLAFKGRRFDAKATLFDYKGQSTPFVLWRISKEDELHLDNYEGVPQVYEKRLVDIDIDSEKMSAILYIMQPQFELGQPSEEYLNKIKDAYIHYNFDSTPLRIGLGLTLQHMPEQDTVRETLGLEQKG